MILDAKEILPKVIDAYDNGWGKIYDLGLKSLSPYYNIIEGSCTDWTGNPGSGKTELLLDCIKNTSEWYGHKYLIHMPDAGSMTELITKLMHKVSGKQFDEFYIDKYGEKIEINNRLSKSEVMNLTPMILDMFKIFYPKGKGSKNVTPIEYWNYAAENKKKLGIFGAVIDSWNYMKHDTEGYSREDKWLEYVLSQRNMIAEDNGLHFHTIIHPKSEKKNKDGKTVMPDMYSLKGGSEWPNNAKSIIIVHREFGSKITDVKIEKAKPKRVGKQGIIPLMLDIDKGSFYEVVGSGEKRYPSIKTESKIEPNNEFNNTPF